MPAVYLVAAFVYQLYDMVAEFRLYYLRNPLRVAEVECHLRKRRVEMPSSCEAELTALSCRARVFRIETRQRRKGCGARLHTVGIVAQLVLYLIYLLNRYSWLIGYNLHLYRCRHEGYAILWHLPEILAHFRWCHLHILHQFAAHTLCQLPVFEVIVQFFLYLRDAHLAVFLQFLSRTNHLNPVFYLLFHALCYLRLCHFDTVYRRLIEEKLLHRYLFWYAAVWVSVPCHALLLGL